MTADPGPRVATVLSPLRDVANEILVAVDARVDPERLGLYEDVADMVVRFEFGSFVEQSLAWASSLCSGDWILRLDGDEIASAELIAALPRLLEAGDVFQYYVPCRWVHPDGTRWFDEWPWSPDFSNRLVRNDARLHFEGRAHSGVSPDVPARYIEEPFYHLVCAVSSKVERETKVVRYDGIEPTLKAKDSDRLLRHYYLPEDHAALEPVAIQAEDVRQIEAWLRAGAETAPTRSRPIPLYERSEIDLFWAQRPLGASAYRAVIQPVSEHRRMRAGEDRPFRVLVRNEGDASWPGGHARDPQIRLSYHWRSRDDRVEEGYRSPLPAPLYPGESCIAPVIVAAPDEPGEYVLQLDLVHEHVRWFDCGMDVTMSVEPERRAGGGPDGGRHVARAVVPAVAVRPDHPTASEKSVPVRDGAAAVVSVVDRHRWMVAGFHTPFHVHVRNRGGKAWPGDDRQRPIRLSYRWLSPCSGASLVEGVRTAFPVTLNPGAEVIVPMVVQAPVELGRYVLEIDVVHEFVRWFECGVRVEIDVRSPEETARLDVGSWAPKWLANADPQFFDRVTRLCGLVHEDAERCLFRPGSPVTVSVPSLNEAAIWLRPATSDLRVLDDTFWGRYHLPQTQLPTPRVIVDLGANIGLTMAHFAHLFCEARVAGVELDGENAALCHDNIAPWSGRCTITHAGVWSDERKVAYQRTPGDAWAYRISNDDADESVMVDAMTLDDLLDSVVPNETVDFLKVDIEGAEQALFKAGGRWTERVRALKVETHEPYSVGACLSDLKRLGFVASPDETHWSAVAAQRR